MGGEFGKRNQTQTTSDREGTVSIEQEQALISAIVLAPQVLFEVSGIVGRQDFESPVHRALYGAMLDARLVKAQIEPVYLAKAAEDFGIDPQLARLEIGRAINVGVPSNAKLYAVAIREQRDLERRQLLASKFLESIATPGADGDEIQSQLIRQLRAIGGTAQNAQVKTAHQIVNEEIRRLVADKKTGASNCIPTGFESIDRVTGGLSKCELTTIAAQLDSVRHRLRWKLPIGQHV